MCALAIEYVDDRLAALSARLRRVLRPDGALVLSRLHPTGDWLRHGVASFDVPDADIQETWSPGWTVRYWLAPLERTCEEIFAAGFLIERPAEPRPVPEAAAIDPAEYEQAWPASLGDSSPSGSGYAYEPRAATADDGTTMYARPEHPQRQMSTSPRKPYLPGRRHP